MYIVIDRVDLILESEYFFKFRIKLTMKYSD